MGLKLHVIKGSATRLDHVDHVNEQAREFCEDLDNDVHHTNVVVIGVYLYIYIWYRKALHFRMGEMRKDGNVNTSNGIDKC